MNSVQNGLKMIGGFLVRYFQKLYLTDLTWLNSEHLDFPSLKGWKILRKKKRIK
ncbi:hypothetical protein [Leptospira borgpetersenii]|uniref:hypothetical protein n=1 Tax=Leptospira borgpetersenii TaxID=174 RepID=UPI001D144D1E